MLPWSADLAGRIDEHVITSELLRGNPLGDPYERPLWVYVPPGYDDDPARRYPAVYVIQGYTGHLARCGATARPTGSRSPRRPTRCSRPGRRPAAIVVYVDAWTALRRQPVRGLARAPAATTPTSATRSCPGWTRTTGRWPRPAHRGDHGQVQRRVRRDDHADAPAGPVRRAGHARRGLALRAVLHPGVRQVRASPARLRRGHLALVGRLPARGPRSPRKPTTTC